MLARMFGGKLTTRQFAVLMNMNDNERELAKQARLDDFKTEHHAKDQIRVAEEFIESYRRRKVVDGEWPEDQSHQLMQQEMDKVVTKFPTRSSYDIHIRESKKN